MPSSAYECTTCERSVSADGATEAGAFDAIDDSRWATLCCPHCGTRLTTAFVG